MNQNFSDMLLQNLCISRDPAQNTDSGVVADARDGMSHLSRGGNGRDGPAAEGERRRESKEIVFDQVDGTSGAQDLGG